MKFLNIVLVVGLILLSSTAQTRPISYPGGWTSMVMNDGDMNSVHLHYSPSFKYSLGYRFEHRRNGDNNLHLFQMNNLLKRWNSQASQANLYLKSAVGFSDEGLAGFTGFATDWENRRFFTSYENRFTKVAEEDQFFRQSARVGVAPYIGDYGDLHTWFMVQFDHEPEDREKFTVTPMVRFFKDVHLVEVGVSNQGDVLANWIIRY